MPSAILLIPLLLLVSGVPLRAQTTHPGRSDNPHRTDLQLTLDAGSTAISSLSITGDLTATGQLTMISPSTGTSFLTADDTSGLTVSGDLSVSGHVNSQSYYSSVTGNSPDGTDPPAVYGPPRVLNFQKHQATSRLRITYSENLRVIGRAGAIWQVLIDGSPISSPHPLTMGHFEETTNDYQYTQCTLVGFADGIPAGSHTITIGLAAAGGSPDTYVGWNSSFLIEVLEIP